MRVLHLVAPPGAGLARCLATLNPGDALLLLDGAQPSAEMLQTAAAKGVAVYLLGPEGAGSVAPNDAGLACVDFDGFATLTEACEISVSWS